MPHSYFLAHRLLNASYRNTTFTPAANVFVALFTTLPGRDGTGGVELSASGYTRQATTFDAPTTGRIISAAKVTMSASTPVAWNGLVGFGFYDAASGGNLLGYEAFSSTRSYPSGQEVSFAIGELQVET